MPSTAATVFHANVADVARLADIHTLLTGKKRGRRREVAVLNKAAVVFVTACWESYVEDALLEGVGHLVTWAPNVGTLPQPFQDGVGKRLQRLVTDGTGSPADVACWAGSTPGWKALATLHAEPVFLGRFHTPKTAAVNEKLKAALGLVDVSASWRWEKMSRKQAEDALDGFVTVRGNIAHRVHHTVAVRKSLPKAYLNHVKRLVEKTDDALGSHLAGIVGAAPW